ncbi:transcriptional regulator [Candidatus Palauibacter sp.]|uniref:transcriptional regulator n=1 Tax=Candidatus Palauibacter sp. TaxID=3101350 RepID=UPI003B01A2AA
MLFVETSAFTKHLPAHLDDDAYAALQAFLGEQPNAGPVIRGSGGIRKIRWGSKGRGKRGGIRVIYYWRVPEACIYLFTLYGKGVRDDLTPGELAAWRCAVEAIDHE